MGCLLLLCLWFEILAPCSHLTPHTSYLPPVTPPSSRSRCGFERKLIWTRTEGQYNPCLCFKSWYAWALLVVSRTSAAMMYLLFSVVLVTKLRFLTSFLQNTAYSHFW